MIEKIIYINLDSRVDRKEHMDEMLKLVGMPFERFSAVQPTLESILCGEYKEFYEKACKRFQDWCHQPSYHKRAIGVFGCYLSHYKIHKKMIGNKKPYIILEDDVKVPVKLKSIIQETLANSKYKDYDIIRNLWPSDECNQIDKFEQNHIGSRFSKKNNHHNIFGGSHFSIFRDAKKIISFLDREAVIAADAVLSTKELSVYNLKKPSIGIAPFGTDIPKHD